MNESDRPTDLFVAQGAKPPGARCGILFDPGTNCLNDKDVP